MQNTVLSQTISRLLADGQQVLASAYVETHPRVRRDTNDPNRVDLQKFIKWRAECLHLLQMLGSYGAAWNDAFNNATCAPDNTKRMIGKLEAVQSIVQHGLLLKIEDLIRAEAFNSLLEQAEYLLSEGYFLAAGVLGRAVFEEHLREWCALKGCAPAKSKPTLNDYKDNLYKAKHISVTVMKHFEAIAAVGNEAAHNSPTLDKDAVERMLRDVRDVLLKHPLV